MLALTPSAECLERSRVANREANHEQVIEALVAAWRHCREPWLAELIDSWIVAVAEERAPVGSATHSLHQEWLARAAQGLSADLPHLVGSIARGTGGQCAERVRALGRWAPNPFIARVFAGWALNASFARDHLSRCLMPALEALALIEDPRAGPMLTDALAAPEGPGGRPRAFLTEVLARRSSGWRVLEPIPQSAREGLEPPVRRRRSAAALLANTYDAPDDLDARRVLADTLLDEGDVRGEFILLQLARSRSTRAGQREKELLAQYGATWLGPLAGLFRSYSFERGFLVGGTARGQACDQQALEDRAWGLVEWLNVSASPGFLTEGLLRVTPRLQRVKGQVSEVLRGASWPLPLVEFEGTLGYDTNFESLGSAAASLPGLARLSLRSDYLQEFRAEEVMRFLGTPLALQLRRLEVELPALRTHDEGVALHDLLSAALATGRGQFNLTSGDVRVEVDAAALHALVHFETPPPGPFFLPEFHSVELSGDETGVQRFRSRIQAQGHAVRVRGP